MKGDKIRWGIMGLGTIAHKFAAGLRAVPDAELVAVASRTKDKAEAFGAEFGVARCHGSYAELANDPEVDVVYVATPHPMHAPNSTLCLRAGKAVLCEKPFTATRREAEALVAVAREEKRFLMEAMWKRFLPVSVQVRQWLAEGRIGEPRMVQADFGFRSSIEEEERLFNPEYAGGSLLDVGIYCISCANMVFGGAPERITGMADVGRTGVDEQAAFVLGYSGGRLAVLSSAIRTTTPQEAVIMGTEGLIRLHAPFWSGKRVTIAIEGREPETLECPYPGNGYNCQAVAVGECLRAGRTECDVMPLDESVRLMGVMDELRAQWGVRYPMDA